MAIRSSPGSVAGGSRSLEILDRDWGTLRNGVSPSWSDGLFRPFLTRVRPWRDDQGKIRRWFGSNTEITIQQQVAAELTEQKRVLETLNRTAGLIAVEFDQHKLVKAVTDAALDLTKAQFGAFFYNVVDEGGESYTLYTISGVPREKFSKFPMPRNTQVFDPTFRGTA